MATRAQGDKIINPNPLTFSHFTLMGNMKGEDKRKSLAARRGEKELGTPWSLVNYPQETAARCAFLLPHNCMNCILCFVNMFPPSPWLLIYLLCDLNESAMISVQ